MTSYASVRVRCPACGKEFRDRVLASANNFGWAQWSDGYGSGRVFRPRCAVRLCDCGAYFLVHEAIAGLLPEPEQLLPRRSGWPLAQRSEPPPPLPQMIQTPDIEAAMGSIAERMPGTAVEREIRVWCFWTRNRGREGIAGADPLAAGDDNTVRLLEAVEGAEGLPGLLVKGQALRDLGRFTEAGQTYERLQGPEAWKAQLLELAERRKAEVVRLA